MSKKSIKKTTEKQVKTKDRPKIRERIISKIYGVALKPVFGFVRYQISGLLDDLNESIVEKIAACVFFFFSFLMVYAVFICLGVLVAAALVDFAHLSWLKAFLCVMPFYLLLLIISMSIGSSLLGKPLLPYRKRRTEAEKDNDKS